MPGGLGGLASLPPEMLDLVADAACAHADRGLVVVPASDSDTATSDSDHWAAKQHARRRKTAWHVPPQPRGTGGSASPHPPDRVLRVLESESYADIKRLDLSSCRLSGIVGHLRSLCRVVTLDLSNNCLGSAAGPVLDGIAALAALKTLNLSANNLAHFPSAVLSLKNLRELRLGANALSVVPTEIARLARLEVLYLGGNRLEVLPAEIGRLQSLTVLYLGDNRLTWLPAELMDMHALITLDVHGNELETLPPGLMTMSNLETFSVRDNPLISRFALDSNYQVPSLMELAAGAIVTTPAVARDLSCLPDHLSTFLESARRCENPRCAGVYFTESLTTTVQLSDFCGRYRVPFMKYICSQKHCQDANQKGTGCSAKAASIMKRSSHADAGAVRRVLITPSSDE